MTRHQLYLCLYFFTPLIYFFSLPLSLVDLGVWIAQGRYFLEHGEVLRQDIYSVLATEELVYPTVLPVLYGWLYNHSGLLAVGLFHKVILFFYLLIIYIFSLRPFAHPWNLKNSALILVSWLGLALLCVDRPAFVAILPFTLSFILLETKAELSLKKMLLLILIHLVWVNSHGSWCLLPLMWGWRILWRFVRAHNPPWKECCALGVVFVLCGVNPFGFKIIPYIWQTAQISAARRIDEWTTIFSPQHWFQAIMYLGLLGFLGREIYERKKRGRESLREIFSSPAIPLALMGLHSVRHTIWIFLIILPFCYNYGMLNLKTNKNSHSFFLRFINAVIGLSLVFLMFAFTPYFKSSFRFLLPSDKKMIFSETSPLPALYFLEKSGDQGAIFNDWSYGSFLILYQSRKITMDTRNIIYSDQDFEMYERVLAGEHWEEYFERYDFHFAILNQHNSVRLIQAMKASGEWIILWQNENTILLQKSQVS